MKQKTGKKVSLPVINYEANYFRYFNPKRRLIVYLLSTRSTRMRDIFFVCLSFDTPPKQYALDVIVTMLSLIHICVKD